jgi:hypothetical protein
MHNGNLKYILFYLLIIPVSCFSQSLQIQVELKQAAGKEIFLANHYLGNIYAKDTIRLDNEGRGMFTADSLLPQGLYKIFADEKHHFDFLLGAGQQFTLKNESFLSETMEIEGSEETAAFAEYTGYLKDLQQKGSAIRSKMDTATEEEKKHLTRQLEELTNDSLLLMARYYYQRTTTGIILITGMNVFYILLFIRISLKHGSPKYFISIMIL